MKTKIKYFFLLLGFVFCHFFSHAQMSALGAHYNVDSLLVLLKTVKEDTNKANDLNYLARELATQNPDTGILLSSQALELSEKLNFKRGIAGSYLRLGWFYYIRGDYPKALDYYNKALTIVEKLDDKIIMSFAYGLMGQVYDSEDDPQKALQYYFKSLKMDEASGNKWGIARNLGVIGIVYYNQRKYSVALDYFTKALKRCEEIGNQNGVAVWMSNMGSLYSDSAMALSKESSKNGRDSLIQKALFYNFKALKIFQDLGNDWSTASTLAGIGQVYCNTKDFQNSYDFLYRGLALSQSIGSMDDVKSCYVLLSSLYEKSTIPLKDTVGGVLLSLEGMRLRALYYHKRFMTIRDTLFSQERHKQIMNVEFEMKEAAAKAQHEKEMAIEEADKKRQEIVIWTTVLGLLFTLIFLGFIFRTLRITKRQKALIEIKSIETEEQKKIIEEKNKDILDSIHYAKRIQNSLLPTDKFLDKTLKRLKRK